jgi:hypothetical protein
MDVVFIQFKGLFVGFFFVGVVFFLLLPLYGGCLLSGDTLKWESGAKPELYPQL